MTHTTRDTLLKQFDTAWRLMSYHLNDLTTDECLRQPALRGLHISQGVDHVWRADWPTHEGYDLGPPSIAWITWHVIFWWSMALDHSFGPGALKREAVTWPGDAKATRKAIAALQERWSSALAALTDADFASAERTRWPYKERPFADVVAWVNMELTKNAAEIGYARFLYAVRDER